MKRILVAILTAALAFTCLSAPVQKAEASVYKEEDGYKYYESETSYYTDEDGNQYYMILSVSNITGEAGDYIGDVVYAKDGSVLYKEINGEVIVNNRKVNLRIECEEQWEKETLRIVAGFKADVYLVCDNAHENGWEKNPEATWSSSDTSIASINKDGKITAKKAGEVTITATAKENGQKATKKVKVVKNQYKEVTTSVNCMDAITPIRCKVTRTAWYDASGNLKCRVSYKGMEKLGKKIQVTANGVTFTQKLGTQYKITLEDAVSVKGKELKSFTKRISDIKKGKTVTKTYTIKNAKYVDLTDKDGDFRWHVYTYIRRDGKPPMRPKK